MGQSSCRCLVLLAYRLHFNALPLCDAVVHLNIPPFEKKKKSILRSLVLLFKQTLHSIVEQQHFTELRVPQKYWPDIFHRAEIALHANKTQRAKARRAATGVEGEQSIQASFQRFNEASHRDSISIDVTPGGVSIQTLTRPVLYFTYGAWPVRSGIKDNPPCQINHPWGG